MTEIDSEFDFSAASEDPERAAAAVETAFAPDVKEPVLQEPQDGPVTLVVGFRRPTGDEGEFETVRKAWVRELNGYDEERISKARQREDLNEFINALLLSGVEKLGNRVPTTDDLVNLTVADRSYLLLEVARATYGNDLDIQGFICPGCGEEISFTVHLDEDIPNTRLASVEDAEFEVRLSRDRVAVVTFPTGAVSSLMGEAKTEGEANTVLIAHCVQEIRGPKGVVDVAGDMDAARSLSVPDRLTLVTEMNERAPGPKYNEVRFTHPDCGKEVRFSVSLADLFRGL